MISSPHIELSKPVLSDVEKSSQSTLMKDIFYKVIYLAKLDVNVVVVGEIGSGKKRLGKIIHANSNRSDGPFHSFYCVDVGENEYKNAFWGHLNFKGDHLKLEYRALEKASNGILFLDQFSELPPHLMNSIIESYIKGCDHLFRYNTQARPRLILSLNKESYQQILNSSVWEKILNQLDPVEIMMPPLRERKEDIPLLINSILEDIRQSSDKFKDLKISSQALCECLEYSWPGNIRQLKNAIRQGAILSYGKTIESWHLPFTINWQLPYEVDKNKK